MAPLDPQRQDLIKAAFTRRPEGIAQISTRLWEQLASELVLVIGAGGFNPIFTRSVHLTGKRFPALVQASSGGLGRGGFAALGNCLEAMGPEQASAASMELLETFLSTLAALIGENLSARLLERAWPQYELKILDKDLLA